MSGDIYRISRVFICRSEPCLTVEQYGTLTHNPIHHLDRSLSFHELCALYAVTDIALVTSLRRHKTS
jgi:hypothetical protein